jgi:hypothetical protein
VRTGRLAAAVLVAPLVLGACGGGGVDRAAIIADTEAQLTTMGMPDDVTGCVTAEINKLGDEDLAAIDTNAASADTEDGFKRAVLLCMKGYLVDETQTQLASSGASEPVQTCVGDYINGLADDALAALVLDGSPDAQEALQSAVLECMTSG